VGLDLAAILTGIAGIIAAAGGILLAIRAVRDRERRAAKHELDEVTGMLAVERERTIVLEAVMHEQRRTLARHGLPVPDLPPRPPPESMPRQLG
jgi:hypothetical protein